MTRLGDTCDHRIWGKMVPRKPDQGVQYKVAATLSHISDRANRAPCPDAPPFSHDRAEGHLRFESINETRSLPLTRSLSPMHRTLSNCVMSNSPANIYTNNSSLSSDSTGFLLHLSTSCSSKYEQLSAQPSALFQPSDNHLSSSLPLRSSTSKEPWPPPQPPSVSRIRPC